MTEEITENNEEPKELTGKERSLANLRAPFSSENQPANAGRPKGALNRKTVFEKWVGATALQKFVIAVKEELGDDAPEIETIADLFMAKKVLKALNGDEGTIDSMFDNLFGKLADNSNINNNTNLSIGAVLEEIGKNKPPGLPKVAPPPERAKQSTPQPSAVTTAPLSSQSIKAEPSPTQLPPLNLPKL